MLSPALLAAGKQEALSTQYELHADGTFEASSELMPNGQSGAWAYKEEGKQLTFVYLETPDDAESYAVQSVSSGKAVWLMGIEGMGIMQFTLERK